MEIKQDIQQDTTREANRQILTRSFEQFLKPIVQKEDPRVLSVGCGFGYEAAAIRSIFQNPTYLGIDINKGIVGGAKKMNNDLPGDFSFEQADARNQEAFGTTPWDVILLRHPQVLGSVLNPVLENDWQSIIDNSCAALVRGGVVFSTVLSSEERVKVVKTLKRNKMTIITDEINPLPAQNGIEDWAIIVGQKE